MDLLFYLAAIAAIFHFIYEGIIAPTLRVKIDHGLFELRDNLRAVKIDLDDACDERAYSIVDDGINMYIGRIGLVTVSFVVWLRAQLKDASLRDELHDRYKAVKTCGTPELMGISQKGQALVEQALIVNSLPLAIFLTPFSLVAMLTSWVHRQGRKLFSTPMQRTEALIEHSSMVRMRA